MTKTVLHIDASARNDGSVSRGLTANILRQIGGTVIRRDLRDGVPLLSEDWINANFTPADDRSDDQRALLALSDTLIDEIKSADVLVIGTPVYNFAVPAVLKAWVDLICRAGQTFQYSEAGPKGLLDGKRAIIALASGGTEVGSDIDFASGYLRHILGFIGITDVQVVAADRVMAEGEDAIAEANRQIDALAA